MNTTIQRADQFEGRFERLLVDFTALKQQVAALIGQIQGLQGGNQQPGGGGGIFIMAGVVIGAGASVTGATVDWVIGGTAVVASTTATVWNMMQSATVASKTIVLGANPDGSFTVISQSC